jgi:hypothetical protein
MLDERSAMAATMIPVRLPAHSPTPGLEGGVGE